MSRDDTAHEAPTRRDYVKYGSAVVGGGLLAGCTGDGAGDETEGDTSTENETTDEETEDSEDTSYSVTMAPMGEMTFEQVPETAVLFDDVWADHLVALGQHDKIVATGRPGGYFTDRGRELPPGCEEIDEAERRDREVRSLDVMAERFVEPHPDEQQTHPSLSED